MKTRSTRDLDTRDLDTRASDFRANDLHSSSEYDPLDPLAIPPKLKIPGYVYRWVRRCIKNVDDSAVETAAAEGWTLVPAERAPEYCLDPMGRNPYSQKFFCKKDVVLMERPAILSERARQLLHQTNIMKLKSLPGVETDYDPFKKHRSAMIGSI